MTDLNLETALEQIDTLKLEIAKYKQKETKLNESEEKYRQLFENSRDALMTITPPSWKFSSANKAALELFGVSSLTEFTAIGPLDLSPEIQPNGLSSLEEAQKMLKIAMRDGSNLFEWEHCTIDGKVFAADILLTRLEIGDQLLVQATVRDISDKKKIEEKLRQERDFSNRLIENAPIVIVILNKEGKIVRFNHFFKKLTGYSLDEVKGKDWFETFLPQDQREGIRSIFLQAINDIQTAGNVNPILAKDGTEKMVEWYDKTLKDAKNNTIGLISIGLDITKRTEESKQLKMFRTIIDHSSDSIEILEPATMKFLDINEKGCEILGYTKEEMLSMSAFDIDPTLDVDEIKAAQEEFREKKEVHIIGTHRRKDGSTFPVEINSVLVELDQPYLLCIVRDITKSKKIEQELRESEEKFRALVESASDWIWEVDANGTYTYVSPNVETLLGYKPQEIIGKSPFELMPPEEAIRVGDIFIELLKESAPLLAIKNTNISKDGSLKILETNGIPFFDEDGALLGYRGIDRDITEREQVEQSLRDSEAKLHSITTSAQDAIIMMNNDGNVFYWNEAAEKIFGYSEEEVIDKNLHSLIAPKRFHKAHKKAFQHFIKTGEGSVVGKTIELIALKKDGTEFPIELSLSATLIDGSWNAIGIIRDITERKEMENDIILKEEMMLAQSKQAAMGDLISMIAHQWRQPLAIISMDINNLRASVELEEEITSEDLIKHVDSVYKQLHQLSETIDNFRNFFKPDQPKEEIHIDDALNSTLDIIGTSLSNNNISLNIKNSSKSSLLINKASLIQVLLNIIGNAKDVLLSKKVPKATINITVHEEKGIITISICDNGGGIPESTIDKIAQPYFTTKQSLNGTGLGLYISQTIIKKHLLGTFNWYNKDEGACFVITLSSDQGE